MRSLLRKAATFLGVRSPNSLRAQLVRGTGGGFLLKMANAGLMLLTSIVLARTLGASGYGIFSYSISMMTLLGVIAALGLPGLLTRNVAVYASTRQWSLLRGLLVRSNQVAVFASFSIATLACILALQFSDRFTPVALTTFWLAMILVVFQTIGATRTAALSGLKHVVLAQVPENLIQPSLFLLLFFVLSLVLDGIGIDSAHAMVLRIISGGIAAAVGIAFLIQALPRDVRSVTADFRYREWKSSALSFMALSGVGVMNSHTDILMLGLFVDSEQIGYYRAAVTLASLVAFMLAAVNSALAPTIAQLYALGDMRRLQRIVTLSARTVLMASIPFALVFIAFGEWFLQIIFGPSFHEGKTALAILCVGQLVNAAMGSVGILLNMSGHERDTLRVQGLSALINITLNAVLIPLWGLTGAAVATGTSMACWNVLLAVAVKSRLGLSPTAFGKISGSSKGSHS